MRTLCGLLVGAALAIGATFSVAEAAPASAGLMLASELPAAMVEQVQHRHYHHPRRHYRAPGYHRHYYRAPPRHYHRPPPRYYPHRHYAPRPYGRPHRYYRY